MLERLDAELVSMRDQMAEMNQRVSSVESGIPTQLAPLHVQLAPEAIEQIAAAVAGLSASGVEALGEALAAGGDDLAASIATLVKGEIERTLAEAGLDVAVTAESPQAPDETADAQDPDVDIAVADETADAQDPDVDIAVADETADAQDPDVDIAVADTPVAEAPVVEIADVGEPVPEAPAPRAAVGTPIVSLADSVTLNDEEPLPAGQRDGFGIDDEDDPAAFSDDTDRPPLALAELDDPFLDALIRREPLSA